MIEDILYDTILQCGDACVLSDSIDCVLVSLVIREIRDVRGVRDVMGPKGMRGESE